LVQGLAIHRGTPYEIRYADHPSAHSVVDFAGIYVLYLVLAVGLLEPYTPDLLPPVMFLPAPESPAPVQSRTALWPRARSWYQHRPDGIAAARPSSRISSRSRYTGIWQRFQKTAGNENEDNTLCSGFMQHTNQLFRNRRLRSGGPYRRLACLRKWRLFTRLLLLDTLQSDC
jgi:hypothetical protein